MPTLNDLLKVDSLPLAGLGLLAVAAPFLFPALRPQLATILKSGIKLFLEAELGAEAALTDRLVDASVDALLATTSHGTEDDRRQKAEREVNRFVSAASASAHRRGWDEADRHARYRRHLAKLDHALSRARQQAKPSQRAALAHASDVLTKHHVHSRQLTSAGAGGTAGARSQAVPTKAPKHA